MMKLKIMILMEDFKIIQAILLKLYGKIQKKLDLVFQKVKMDILILWQITTQQEIIWVNLNKMY